ncbi:hypothetical protein ACOMHN_025490 [Nucella lapillus]
MTEIHRRDAEREMFERCCRCGRLPPPPSFKPQRPDCTPLGPCAGSACWFDVVFYYCVCRVFFVLSVFVWRSGKGRKKHRVRCYLNLRKPR